MENFSDYADIFYNVLSTITPILVAIIGVIQNRTIKNEKEYRKLREEKELLEQQQKEELERKHDERLLNLETSISKVNEDVVFLKERMNIQKLEHQLSNLYILNEFNFEYVRSISNIVVMVGETLISTNILDEKSKDRLQDEVNNHKEKEHKLANELYKVLV